jgi:RNA polymerase II subunit A-like phosphatase
MKITSPRGLSYPITVVELLKRHDDQVQRSEKLFKYSYDSAFVEGDKWGGEDKKVIRKMIVFFDASTEGTVTRWFIKPGTTIERPGYAPYYAQLLSQS